MWLLEANAARPFYQWQGVSAVAISSGKGRTVEAVVEKLGPFFLFFEGSTSDGRSCKDEGEGKKKGPKYPES